MALLFRLLFARSVSVPRRQCLVLIPCAHGHLDYTVEATSSMDAARQALSVHKASVTDDTILTVIVNGRSPLLHGWREHNQIQPTFRHRAGSVRQKPNWRIT